MAVATRSRLSAQRAPRRRAGTRIRWDRVGRYALLAVLCLILGLYVGPLTRWQTQSENAKVQRAQLDQLEREHLQLRERAAALQNSTALEAEARRLGMVKRGEIPLAIEPVEPTSK